MKPISVSDLAPLEHRRSHYHVDLTSRAEPVADEELLDPKSWVSVGTRAAAGDLIVVTRRAQPDVELLVLQSYGAGGLVVRFRDQETVPQRPHLVVCRDDKAVHFGLREIRDDRTYSVAGEHGSHLESLIRKVAAQLASDDVASFPDVTVTYRTADELASCAPSSAEAWRTGTGQMDSLLIYAPIGHPGENLWGVLHCYTHGLTKARTINPGVHRCVPRLVGDSLLSLFNAGSTVTMGKEPCFREYGRSFLQEIWIRPTWKLCEVLPSDFVQRVVKVEAPAPDEIAERANAWHMSGQKQAEKFARANGYFWDVDRLGRKTYHPPSDDPIERLRNVADRPWMIGADHASQQLLARGWVRERVIPGDGSPHHWRHYDPLTVSGEAVE